MASATGADRIADNREGDADQLTDPVDPVGWARHLLKARGEQRAALRGAGVGTPAWSILLDLYVSEASGQAVTVSAACQVSGAPATSALRCLGRLVDEGHIVRESDPSDRRSVRLSLSRRTHAVLDGLIRSDLAAAARVLNAAARPDDRSAPDRRAERQHPAAR